MNTASGVVVAQGSFGGASVMATADGSGSVESSQQRGGVLDGIFRKFGQTLPVVERVRGDLQVTDFTETVINGFLINGAERIRVRIEPRAKGPFPVLRRYLEAKVAQPESVVLRLLHVVAPRDCTTLSVAAIPAWISGRAWVEQDGVIVVLVRQFGITLPEGV